MVSVARLVRGAGLAGCVVALALAGCSSGPKLGLVQGKVTYKGKPVPHGNVNFIPKAGPPASGEIGPDGTYRLTTFRNHDGAVLGPHTVVIVAIEKNAGKPVEAWNPLPPPIVPARYTSVATTDLRAEVKEGENTFNFDLKDDGAARR